MFGLTMMANAAAAPAPAALPLPPCQAAQSAMPHNAAAGTSLNGCTSMMRNVGLVSIRSAPTRPAHCPAKRVPSRYVIQTVRAPKIGTT